MCDNVTRLHIVRWDFPEFGSHHPIHFLSHFGATLRPLELSPSIIDSGVLTLPTSWFPFADDLRVNL